MKPVIGIPNETYKSENYEKAITDHRGEVEILPIHNNKDKVKEFIAKIDGLLLPGGGDIDPEIYGEVRHPNTQYVNEERDEFEILLFEEAMEKDIPVFGICRGIQIMNVAMCGGGSLYQHIPEPLPALFSDFPIHKKYRADTQHDIKITTGSQLIPN